MAFPDWQPADEKGDEAQLLPRLGDGETAQLQDPKIEDKETKPPPRYNEGTLIEAMQNAWRFVDDDVLRERLKEAKGIGTPATRAEIIGGLKKQNFLMAERKHIVPTETGLSVFGVLEQADPALVDPGVTAQLECLLDDVVVGKQEMNGAIDAVCEVAQRIIGKLKDGAAGGADSPFGAVVGKDAGSYPPTPAMKRFADSLVRKGIKPPAGYQTSIAICRKFLDEHAPRKAAGAVLGEDDAKPRRARNGRKFPQRNDVAVAEDAEMNQAKMSGETNPDADTKRAKSGSNTPRRRTRSVAPRSRAPKQTPRKRKPASAAFATTQSDPAPGTPLNIPYGNKDVAMRLGARYRPGGWYAPPGVDLTAFGERGWL
jgi:DNA topoisomerase-3